MTLNSNILYVRTRYIVMIVTDVTPNLKKEMEGTLFRFGVLIIIMYEQLLQFYYEIKPQILKNNQLFSTCCRYENIHT